MKHFVIALSLVGGLGARLLSERSAVQTANGVHVCVSTDRVMRVESGPACPNGQTSYHLAVLGMSGGAPPSNDKTDTQVADLKQALDLLKARVQSLEHDVAAEQSAKGKLDQKAVAPAEPSAKGKLGQTVVAPFVVVDKAGKTILRVRDDLHGFEMTNAAGQTVLWASALDNGGVFKTRSSGNFPEVVMGAVGTLGGFTIRDGEDADRASLTLAGGKTSFDLRNDNHTNIASLHQATTGGGFLQLGAASGESVVQAGVTSGGKCGRVDTYPLTNPGRSLVGAAASFIVGKC